MGDRGTRAVRGTIVLPAGTPDAKADVLVQVEDVSRADAPSRVVGQALRKGMKLRAGGELRYEVKVPADMVEEGGSYAVRVHVDFSGSGEVEVGDLVSTQSHPVLTRGHPDTAVVPVRKV